MTAITKQQIELPREIITHILSYVHDERHLLNAGLSCKAWLTPALECIWSSTVCLSDEWDEITKLFSRPKLLFLDYRHFINKLSIHASSHGWYTGDLKMNHFRKFLQPCRSLTSLHLGIPALNDDDIWLLTTACPHLSIVSLTSGIQSNVRITDEGIVALAQNCKQLQKFYFTAFSVDCLTDRGLGALSEHTDGRLIGFGLELSPYSTTASASGSSMVPISDRVHPIGTSRTNEVGFESHTPLRSPAHSGTSSFDGKRRFVQTLCGLLTSNPQLEDLCLDWPFGALEALLAARETLTHLISLKIGNLFIVEGIRDLIQSSAKTLKKVSFFDTNFQNVPIKSAFEPLSEYPAGLKELELQGIGFLTDLVPVASMFPNITVLKLTQSNRAASLINFATEDHVCELFKNAPHLVTVHIPLVTDIPLITLGNSCPDLEDVDIIDGRYMSNKGLTLFSIAARKLKKLALGSAKDINDNAVEILARDCKSLRHLTLPFGAQGISVRSIDALTLSCTKLQGLANIPHSVNPDDLVRCLARLSRLLLVSICCAGYGGPLAGRYTMSRMDQDRIKASCKRLKHIILNG